LKKNNLKRIELKDGINKVTLISALTTKTLQMKQKPFFIHIMVGLCWRLPQGWPSQSQIFHKDGALRKLELD
jgi:hypothetical protein